MKQTNQTNQTNMNLSESEGTGIRLSDTHTRQRRFSESEGTGIKALMILGLMMVSQWSFANSLFLFTDKNNSETYSGTFYSSENKSVFQIEGYIENGVFIGIDTTTPALDSSDDGTGGTSLAGLVSLDSSDDGTGGSVNSELILSVTLDCGLSASIETATSVQDLTITEVYLDGIKMGCASE